MEHSSHIAPHLDTSAHPRAHGVVPSGPHSSLGNWHDHTEETADGQATWQAEGGRVGDREG